MLVSVKASDTTRMFAALAVAGSPSQAPRRSRLGRRVRRRAEARRRMRLPGWPEARGSSRRMTYDPPAMTKREPWIVVVLGLFTCGFYLLYWQYVTTDELKRAT